jgi:hypothetical protein
MRQLLELTAIIEGSTGLALLVAPSMVVLLLLGSPLEASTGVTLGRVAGAALLALGVACGLARDETQSVAARGLIIAMTVYNVGAVVVLGAAGIGARPVGVVLWPAVILHAVMTAWCGVILMSTKGTQAT